MEIERKIKNGVEYKNISLSKIPLDGSITIKKIHPQAKEIETKFGQRFITEIEYKGEKVTLFLTPKQNELLEECPVGIVTITRGVADYSGRLLNKYEFTPVGSTTVNIVGNRTEPQEKTLSDKQKLILKDMISGMKEPTSEIIVDGIKTTYKDYLGETVVNNPHLYLK